MSFAVKEKKPWGAAGWNHPLRRGLGGEVRVAPLDVPRGRGRGRDYIILSFILSIILSAWLF